jgi:HlyD family secretion protein
MSAIPSEDVQLHIPELGKRARRTRWLVGLLLVISAGGLATAYFLRSSPLRETYRSLPVTRQNIVRVVEATGHLDASARVQVSAKAAGHLAEIRVAPGDTVKRGQILARLDDRASEIGVRSAGATLQASVWRVAEAKTAHESSVAELERVQRLAGRGLASAADVEAAQAVAARADAQLKAAGAEKSVASDNVAAARFGQNLGDIVAPIDGIVLVGPENPGAPVSPERAPLFVVATPLARLRIDADVSEADIGDLRVGQTASFEVQAYPGRSWTARVERIGLEPTRDGAVVTYPVLLSAENPDGRLLPGMTAAVRIEVARANGVLAVREAALRFTPEEAAEAPSRSRVWLHRGVSQLTALAVKPGLSDGAYTEVKPDAPAELNPGDRVAVGLLAAAQSDGRAQPGVSLGSKK